MEKFELEKGDSGKEKIQVPQFVYDDRLLKSYIQNNIISKYWVGKSESEILAVQWAILEFAKRFYIKEEEKDSIIIDLQNTWGKDYPRNEREAIKDGIDKFFEINKMS